MPRIPGFGGNVSPKTLFVFLIVPMFAIALGLRIAFSFTPPPRPDMLPPADGMIESTSVADAQRHTRMEIVLPSDTLGGAVYSVGTYTRAAGSLPVGSVIVNMTRDNRRIVEIVERPSTSLSDVLNDYRAAGSQEVSLGDSKGSVLFLPTSRLPCVSSNERWNLPGFCEITTVIAFEADGIVYAIGADGSNATVGELILMAKDILAR